VHQNYHKACTFTQTFDAILYLNKCSSAPILNFSPTCSIGGSTKGLIPNRVFLAIFAPIFCRFWRTLWHQLQKSEQFLDGLYTVTVVQGEFSAGIALPFISDAFFSSLCLHPVSGPLGLKWGYL